MNSTKARITRANVAREAGVSESTVSRALSNSPRISEGIKEKVRMVSTRLGYIPNRQAAFLARNKTFRLGLVVRTYKSFTPFSRSYFPRLLDGALQKAEERGYSVTIILDTVGGEDKDLSLPFRSKEVDGLLFSVTPAEDPRFEELKRNDVPMVLVNNRIVGHFCVDCDVRTGMRSALKHAKDLGHHSITYIAGDKSYWDGQNRLETFLKLTEELNLESQVVEGNFSMTRGREAAEELLGDSSNNPSLIMCASDRTALGVMGHCRAEGIEIPRDLSLIGFDNLGPARDSVPGLTTVDHPVTSMGRKAAGMLIDLLEDLSPDPLISVESGFVIRESTGPPRTNRKNFK